ncbi:MAG: hypothetical protein ABIJ97_16655 [Bacteroidota bacterium]
MTLVENTFALSTKLLKESLKKARAKETVEGEYLNYLDSGRPSALDYYIEYSIDGSTYLVVNIGVEPQRILLSEEELTFGTRTYLTCGCGQRTNALYLKEGVFACRECHQLSYQSTTINRSSKHGKFLYKSSLAIKAMKMREGMSHIFYGSRYTKKFNNYLNLCNRAGLFNEVFEAEKLLTAINSQK